MKKLMMLLALVCASFSTQAVMVRTVLIQAQMESNLMCLAGYDGDSMEKISNFLDSVRWNKGPEGDQIPQDESYINFFQGVDHNGYWAGKDIKKAGGAKDVCGDYTIDYIKGLAHRLHADDFIKMNPQVFGESN